MYPLLPIISKVLVPGEGEVGVGRKSGQLGCDQHKATERSMSWGRGWVGQDAKSQMTYVQLLNQTERDRKKKRRGLGKKRKGKARADESGSHIGALLLFPHLRTESLIGCLAISTAH